MSEDSIVGSLIDDGAIVLQRQLGAGAMGAVYEGYQTALDRQVAVKVLRSAHADDEMVARLIDEARAAAKIRHPYLVEVIDGGFCKEHGPFIVYELLPGPTLSQFVRRQGPIPWGEAYQRIGRGLLDALVALHRSGIVHRDVKPENMIGDGSGAFKLSDLGLAVFEGRAARTKTGAFFGTPGYMAPERMSPAASVAEPGHDVYAAAMVLVFATTGRIPFTGDEPMAILRAQLTSKITPRSLRALGIPAKVATVLATALALSPTERYTSADELKAQLELVATETVTAQSTPATELDIEPAERAVNGCAARAASGQAVRTGRRALLAVVGASLLVLSLLFVFRSSSFVSGDDSVAHQQHGMGLEKERARLLAQWPSCPPRAVAALGAMVVASESARGSYIPADAPAELAGLYHLARWSEQRGKLSQAWSYVNLLLRRNKPLRTDGDGQLLAWVATLARRVGDWEGLARSLEFFVEDHSDSDEAKVLLTTALLEHWKAAPDDTSRRVRLIAQRESLWQIAMRPGAMRVRAAECLQASYIVEPTSSCKQVFVEVVEAVAADLSLSRTALREFLISSAERLILGLPTFEADKVHARRWADRARALATNPDEEAETMARMCQLVLEVPLDLLIEGGIVTSRMAAVNKARDLTARAVEQARTPAVKAIALTNRAWSLWYHDRQPISTPLIEKVRFEDLPPRHRWWYWRVRGAIEPAQAAEFMQRAIDTAPPEYIAHASTIGTQQEPLGEH